MMTLAWLACRARRSARALCTAGIAAVVLTGGVPAPAMPQEPRAGFIVWNLPPQDSDAYRRLRELAGVTEQTVLAHTGAEMWAVEPGRAREVRRACTAQGVRFSEFDDRPSELTSAITARVENDESMPPRQTYTPMVQRAMRSDAVASVSILSLKPAPVVEYALMRPPMPEVATDMEGSVTMQLGSGVTVRAKRTRMEMRGDTVFWHGRTADEGMPVNLMWGGDGRFSGTLKHGGRDYVIKTIEGGQYAVIAIDPSKLPPDHPEPAAPSPDAPLQGAARDSTMRIDRRGEDRRNLDDAPDTIEKPPAPRPELIGPPPPPLDTSRPVEINVLFAHTSAAASHYRDMRMELIDLAVEEANQSFRSSGIGQVRIAVAGTYRVDYEEGKGGLFDHLWNLADRHDGHMDEIHQIRDETHADIVVLIVDDPDACGLATRVHADADEAFAVVNHMCAVTSYSIPHEIGHLLGGRHDRAVDDTSRPFPFGHGFVNGNKWRTIMAYKTSCNGCPRLPIWSNPNILIEGERAGDALTFDARVVAEQAARAAAFR